MRRCFDKLKKITHNYHWLHKENVTFYSQHPSSHELPRLDANILVKLTPIRHI